MQEHSPASSIERTSRMVRGLLSSSGVVVLTCLLVACTANSSVDQDTPVESREVPGIETGSLQDQLEASIKARPDQGSPEYEALFENINMPENSVTDPAVVIDSYNNSMLIELPKLILQNAPGGGEDKTVTAWQFEGNGHSVDDLVDILDIDYYMPGVMEKLFGKNWADNLDNKRIIDESILPSIKMLVGNIMADGLNNDSLHYKNSEDGYDIISADDNSIFANSTAIIAYTDSSTQRTSGSLMFIHGEYSWIATASRN